MTSSNTSQPAFKLQALASAIAFAYVSAPALAQDTTGEKTARDIEEVTVTASRRSQSVQEIPYNITAVSSKQLQDAGVGDLSKLMQTVPGISFVDSGSRASALNSTITLRGLTVQSAGDSGYVQNLSVPTVSTYIDETPVYLNLKLTDVERVEVLRGPQGTLYGSGSLAGTVRFIHNKPSTEAFDASVNGSYESVSDGSPSYGVDAFINVPVSDTIALRFSTAYEDKGGIIDAGVFQQQADGSAVLANPTDPVNSPAVLKVVEDADDGETMAVRGAVAIDFTENVNGLLSWHHQETDARGNAYRDVGSRDYKSSVLQGAQASVDETDMTADVINLTVEADLGFASLTSSSSSTEVDLDTQRDITPLQFYIDGIAGAECFVYGCYPRGPFIGKDSATREDFTQEIRLVSQTDGPIDWIAGVYYSDQELSMTMDDEVKGWASWVHMPGSAAGVGGAATDDFYSFWMQGYVADPATVDNQYYTKRNVNFTESAFFGELTYHISDAWQLTGGVRGFSQDVDQNTDFIFSNCGVFCTPGDVQGRINGDASGTFDDQIFKINTSYQITGETQAYGTIAEGFRPGGVNGLPVGFDNITQKDLNYGSDKATNYELGLKGSLGNFDYTLAAFRIDWEDPQVDGFISFMAMPYVANGGEAEVNGLEFSINGHITDSLSVSAGYNYTDSELTEVGSIIGAKEGASLPITAQHQFNFAADYYQSIGEGELHYHLNGLYKGEAWNAIDGTSENAYKLDSFWLFNGVISYEMEKWSAGLFVSNLLDEREAIWAGGRSFGTSWDSAARPRSVGARLGYKF